MRIERSNRLAKFVVVGDWLEMYSGIAHQVLQVDNHVGRVTFHLVRGEKLTYDANETIDTLDGQP